MFDLSDDEVFGQPGYNNVGVTNSSWWAHELHTFGAIKWSPMNQKRKAATAAKHTSH